MKAFIFSVGENTTNLCKRLMDGFHFDTTVIGGKETMIEKYARFIELAYKSGEDVLKIDADIIPNRHIKEIYNDVMEAKNRGALMIQYQNYCLYKNGPNIGNPVFYRKEAIDIIRKHFDKLDPKRPEASAWRLPQINTWTQTSDLLVGLHGAYQRKEEVDRARVNKIERKQDALYDFSVIEELMRDCVPCVGCSREGGDHDGECMVTAKI